MVSWGDLWFILVAVLVILLCICMYKLGYIAAERRFYGKRKRKED